MNRRELIIETFEHPLIESLVEQGLLSERQLIQMILLETEGTSEDGEEEPLRTDPKDNEEYQKIDKKIKGMQSDLKNIPDPATAAKLEAEIKNLSKNYTSTYLIVK